MDKTIVSDKYDAIIIGAGIGGLVCGCYLANAGLRIMLLEQHHKPGGYCSSFRRNGFIFDAAAHSLGSFREGGHLHKIFKDLSIYDSVKVKRSDPSNMIFTPDHNISIWNDINKTKKELSALYPKEKNNIDNFFDYILNIKGQDAIKVRNKTFLDVLEMFFTDKRLISILSIPLLGNGGLPASKMHAFTGISIYSEFILDGGYYIDEGMQKLPDALSKYISGKKGTVLLSRSVERIICDKGSVQGVVLNNGDVMYSNVVISACDAHQVFTRLLDGYEVSHGLENKLIQMEPSLSAFILYIGLNDKLKGALHPGTNIWHLPHYNIEDIYESLSNDSFAEQKYFLYRISPDKNTIQLLVNTSYRNADYWNENKERIQETLINHLENIIPDLRNHIKHVETATPITLAKFTRNYRGSAFGWAHSVEQLFDVDFNIRSSIKGLYLTGHWTAKALGIPGVAYVGSATAKLIMMKDNIMYKQTA
ncbi:MAG: NAD(P)/FAD-dependent oxidoreductase [Nitrospirota bacterium]|nr:MAG: NAD(P)/FAD-dependent oxidoreductase [Nitrospirota bacterium]